jgi:hypothetical protein
MRSHTEVRNPSFGEFVTLIGAMIALSTDAMLPALPQIGQDLGLDMKNRSN